MKNEQHSVSIHFAITLIAAAEGKGLDTRQLLHNAGLNEQLLKQPGLRITPEQLSRLTQEVWKAADDELICMGSRPSRQGVFALMAKHLVHCRKLRSVYHRFAQYYNLIADAFELNFSVEGELATLTLKLTDADNDPDHTLREFLLLLLHRFPSWLIGQRITLEQVTFDFPKPEHSEEHRLMFPGRVEYDQPICSFSFSKKLLDEPVVQTTSTLGGYLRTLPLEWFKRQAYYPVYTRRVLNYLEQAPDLAQTGIEQVAEEAHMTSRNLRRKLSSEGTSFQELKDSVRRDAAIHYLSQPTLTIAQIARELGFSEPTAFTRAFKQWTGVSPSLYRQES
ncbi:AraC family transcriptional regulator [Marinobacterium mangrovicola]|uniref:AraC family transcriptional regulator n=1 Tax=Marinobacterium mangrovicola TaxID=1476959 RepID=A0A4R1GXA6_9GAMM|nr:AraC family transcriptional regulator [Marinobacterium mangrovicola]TCK09072.1 AraC family transcriptional regulator [Marinobacterium mangrovicola]